jgi:hypothetical protein
MNKYQSSYPLIPLIKTPFYTISAVGYGDLGGVNRAGPAVGLGHKADCIIHVLNRLLSCLRDAVRE